MSCPSYVLGTRRRGQSTLSEAAVERARDTLSALRRSGRTGGEEGDSILWALRDLSLEVRQGDVVGLIGHNGCPFDSTSGVGKREITTAESPFG